MKSKERELHKHISKKIKNLVVSLELKHAHLARELKISGAMLSYYLSGEYKIPITIIIKLEKILNVHPGYFIYG